MEEVTIVEVEEVTASKSYMELKKFLKKQKRKHILYTFMPLIFFAESVAMFQIYNLEQIYLIYIGIIISFLQIIIIAIQQYLVHRFKCQLIEYNIEADCIKNHCLYIGDIAVNPQFIINYGYFRKKIYRTDNVVKVYVQQNYAPQNTGLAQAFVLIKRIVILREGQKQIALKVSLNSDYVLDFAVMTINKLIKEKKSGNLNDINKMTYCAFPFYGYFFPALYSVILIAMEIKHNLINVFVEKDDIFGRLLFHIGYDKILTTAGIALVILFIIVNYYLKYKYIGINTDSILINFLIPGIMIAALYTYIMIGQVDYGNISKAARKDFYDYYNNNYECMDICINSSKNFFYENKNSNLYELTHKSHLTIEKYYIDSEKKEYLLEFSGYNCEREKGEYEVEYLKYTKLIVGIKD